MKQVPRHVRILIPLLCFLTLLSCGSVDNRLQQRIARDGLDSITAQELPQLDGFELEKVVSLDDLRNEYGKTCYYSADYQIIGTSLSESKALEQYVEALLSFGWLKEGSQTLNSSALIYEQNARLVIWYGDPGVNVRDAVDYNSLRKIYQGIIFVQVTYMLPSREGC